jgi:NADH-quinone oxidoreductase subunit E
MPFTEEVVARLDADADAIIGKYPGARSALLPLLHLVQAEEGYVSADGLAYCAAKLGLTKTEVTGVVSFYTMYKRQPIGDYSVGVCTRRGLHQRAVRGPGRRPDLCRTEGTSGVRG